MNRVFLTLGSNIEKEHNLPAAIEMLRELATVTAVAPIYESAPVLLEEQPAFWNTAVLIETPLSPTAVKQQLITPIEQALKRPLAEALLFGNLHEGGTAHVDVDTDASETSQIALRFEQPEPAN